MKDKKNNLDSTVEKKQQKKKNGIWITIAVFSAFTLGGATFAGIAYGVPAVCNMFISQEAGTNTGSTSELQKQVAKLTAELSSANNLAEERLTKINSISSELNQVKLNIETLTEELETVKNNAALSEAEKQTQIAELTARIETLTSNETTLQTQLNEAVTAKDQAESIVSGLQAQIAELQAQIDKFEGNQIIDTLKLENFAGTWYKNGTFEDYFIINGLEIRRGDGIDSGIIYKQDNKVKLALRTLNNTGCTLSENGTKITLDDGTVYTKAFINTIEETAVNYAMILGTYNNGYETIKLNSDNTCSYFDGTNTIYGAFTATATLKNSGGNYTRTHNLTLNLNAETPKTMQFQIINDGNLLTLDGATSYVKTVSDNIIELTANGNANFIPENYKKNCIKVIFKTKELITIQSKQRAFLDCGVQYKQAGQNYASDAGYINGVSAFTTGRISQVQLYNPTSSDVTGTTFAIYIQGRNVASDGNQVKVLIDNIISINNIDTDIISVEAIGNWQTDTVTYTDNFLSYIKTTYYKTCNPISDYYTGDLTNDDYNINISSDVATITPAGLEPITATSYTVTAKTDGTNIVHTLTLKYLDADNVEQTLTFEILNNSKILTAVTV